MNFFQKRYAKVRSTTLGPDSAKERPTGMRADSDLFVLEIGMAC